MSEEITVRDHTPERRLDFWALGVSLLLLGWGLRLCCLDAVPPGWRDDELVNIYALSGEVLAGRLPLYFTGASGHEPLYHTLHAGILAVLGFNVLSGHLLSVTLGTLSIALTYALTCRLFGRVPAVIASVALAPSFWSLMYSRIGMRHISLPMLAPAIFILLWGSLEGGCGMRGRATTAGRAGRRFALVGLVVGLAQYTYTAARLLPLLLGLFALYLALFHRALFVRHGRGFLLVLEVAALVSLPLWAAIARGRSEAAAQGIGADARLVELAVPLRELWAGNPRPLLESIWATLGMFHATGDGEWLYNVSGRPVFNLLGGMLLWGGVALCVVRWRQPRYAFMLLWWGVGLLPAFVSTPAASLGHTILAQPAAYILPALTLVESARWLTRRAGGLNRRARFLLQGMGLLLAAVFLVTNAVRDLRDYFVTWPQRGMVRVLYRADYREAAAYLNEHAATADMAIASALMGPWDRLALDVDIQRDDIAVRLFNPERALVWVSQDSPSPMLLLSWPDPTAPIDALLQAEAGPPEIVSSGLALYMLGGEAVAGGGMDVIHFDNGLVLVDAHWVGEEPSAGREATLLTTWRVAAPLDLPPLPVVAIPPPPGVYAGPRLAVFVHLLSAADAFIASEDGLWVDPLTLQPGDRFVQVHRFALPADAPAAPVVEIGLYDPLTGERWHVVDGAGQPTAEAVRLMDLGGEP